MPALRSPRSPLVLILGLAISASAHSAPEAVDSAGVRAATEGLTLPESAVAHPDGRVFVSEIGQFGAPGDGKITIVHPDGRTETLADGLNDPKGIDLHDGHLYVTDVTRVVQVALDGTTTVLAEPDAFATTPVFLNDIEIDDNGTLYVSDSGDEQGQGAAIHAIARDGSIRLLLGADAGIKRPNGLLNDGPGQLLVADFADGGLFRLNFTAAETPPILTQVNQGFGAGDGLARAGDGGIYVSDWAGGNVWHLATPEATPELIASGYQSAADIALSSDGKHLLIPDMKAGLLVFLPIE